MRLPGDTGIASEGLDESLVPLGIPQNWPVAAGHACFSAEHHLTYAPEAPHSVNDLLKKKGERPLITIGPEATAAAAIEMLQTSGISQLPVLADGKPVGSVQERASAEFSVKQRRACSMSQPNQ